MAVLTPVFVIIQQSLDAGILTFNWNSIAMVAVAGGLGVGVLYRTVIGLLAIVF